MGGGLQRLGVTVAWSGNEHHLGAAAKTLRGRPQIVCPAMAAVGLGTHTAALWITEESVIPTGRCVAKRRG